MPIASVVVASSFALLAVAHSAMGESNILRPLFAAEWTTPEVPRWAMQRILRFAWHLTSIAWLGIAAISLEAPIAVTIAVVSLASAALVIVRLPGHLAWPIFLLGGLGAWQWAEPLPDGLLAAAAGIAVAVMAIVALVHVYWAIGGKRGFAAALPTGDDGLATFTPSPLLTLAVAAALAMAAAIVGAVALEIGPTLLRWAAIGITVVFTLRAIGDTKVAGFTKTVRDTDFAERDDKFFTPLCVFLALGVAAALML